MAILVLISFFFCKSQMLVIRSDDNPQLTFSCTDVNTWVSNFVKSQQSINLGGAWIHQSSFYATYCRLYELIDQVFAATFNKLWTSQIMEWCKRQSTAVTDGHKTIRNVSWLVNGTCGFGSCDTYHMHFFIAADFFMLPPKSAVGDLIPGWHI